MDLEIQNNNGQLYMKRDVQRVLSSNPVRGIANAKTIVLFDKSTPLKSVQKSLEVLMHDLAFRIEEEEREALEKKQAMTE